MTDKIIREFGEDLPDLDRANFEILADVLNREQIALILHTPVREYFQERFNELENKLDKQFFLTKCFIDSLNYLNRSMWCEGITERPIESEVNVAMLSHLLENYKTTSLLKFSPCVYTTEHLQVGKAVLPIIEEPWIIYSVGESKFSVVLTVIENKIVFALALHVSGHWVTQLDRESKLLPEFEGILTASLDGRSSLYPKDIIVEYVHQEGLDFGEIPLLVWGAGTDREISVRLTHGCNLIVTREGEE